MKKILLHSCCAPCTSGVLWQLENDYDITLLFYNPNIDTLEEYEKRLKALYDFISKYNKEKGLNIDIIAIPYNHDEFMSKVTKMLDAPEGGIRCKTCIGMRLAYTGKYAKEHGYDIFASTLSVSPHKNHLVINELGNEISNKYGIDYLENNFKKNNGYLISIQNSKKYGIYRQNYCGCNLGNKKDSN